MSPDPLRTARTGAPYETRGYTAAVCAGVAAWCSLGSIGLIGSAAAPSRVALLAPLWLLLVLPLAILGIIRLLRLSSDEVRPLFGSALVLLPWLPIRLPASALLWTGPFVIVIWTAIVGMLVAARLNRSRAAWLVDARRAPLVAAAIACAVYAGSALWLAPILPEGDGPHYLIIAQSIVKDGDLQIENNHTRGDYLEYSLTAAEPAYLRRGVNGAIYSIHAPGLPAIVAPAMAAFGYPGVIAFLTIVAAASTGLVWYLAYRVTANVGAAWFGWASSALTTPFFFQATQVFPDGIAATCVLLGALPLLLEDRDPVGNPRREAGGRSPGAIWALSGAALAVLPWLHPRLAVLALVMALLLALRIRGLRQIASFGLVPLASAILWFGFFRNVYGTYDPRAAFVTDLPRLSNIVRGFPALLFDQQFGLVANAPVYGVILWGVVVGACRLRRWNWELLALTIPYLAVVGGYQMWWGGTSVPARLLTPLTLIVAIGAARVWNESRAVATRTVAGWSLAASVAITAALLGPDHGRLLFNFRDGVALWLEWANDLVDLPKGLPSLFRDDLLHMRLKIAVWIGSACLAWVVLRAAERSASRKNALKLTSLLPMSVILGALMLALTLAWRVDRIEATTPAASELGLLRHASSFRARALTLTSGALTPTQALLRELRIASDQERRRTRPPVVFSVRDITAGSYEIRVPDHPPGDGVLTVRAGNTTLPFQTIAMSAADSRRDLLRLDLPVGLRSLEISADEAARRSVTSAELIPLTTERTPPFGTGLAHRAARYPAGDVFFFDENAYPEPTGFWVAGGRTATIVFANLKADVDLFLRNAPVENSVVVNVGGATDALTLRAGEEQTLRLPSGSASEITVRLTARGGFRPSVAEPGNRDLRYLGCWLEIRPHS